jgi:DNA-binding NtrC family response regulator
MLRRLNRFRQVFLVHATPDILSHRPAPDPIGMRHGPAGRRAPGRVGDQPWARDDAPAPGYSGPEGGENESGAVALRPFVLDEAVRELVGRTLAEIERRLIIGTLDRCSGNRTHAARILGISIRTLRNKLHDYADAGYPVPEAGAQR